MDIEQARTFLAIVATAAFWKPPPGCMWPSPRSARAGSRDQRAWAELGDFRHTPNRNGAWLWDIVFNNLTAEARGTQRTSSSESFQYLWVLRVSAVKTLFMDDH